MRKLVFVIPTSIVLVISGWLFFGESFAPDELPFISNESTSVSDVFEQVPISEEAKKQLADFERLNEYETKLKSTVEKTQDTINIEAHCDEEALPGLLQQLLSNQPGDNLKNRDTIACIKLFLQQQSPEDIDDVNTYILTALLYAESSLQHFLDAFLAELSGQQWYQLLLSWLPNSETKTLLAELTIEEQDFRDALLQQLMNQSPEKLLAVMAQSDDLIFNQQLFANLLLSENLPQIAQTWPVIQNSDWGIEKEKRLEELMQRYLHLDPDATITWLQDYYLLNGESHLGEEQLRDRKYDFPKALNTLNAWHSGSLTDMDAASYDKDSLLVIKYVGDLLTDDIQHFANQLSSVTNTPLADQALASVMQSEQFFRLNNDDLITLLDQLPNDAARALSQAYSLQLQYVSDENKESTLLILNRYSDED